MDFTKTVGLGDIVSKVTSALGMTECTGCASRKASLNKVTLVKQEKKYQPPAYQTTKMHKHMTF
jgi:hypothetical protein